MPSIPVIDMSSLASECTNSLRKVGIELCNAAQDMGFFYVSGHGVPEQVLNAAFDCAEKFFKLPLQQKNQVEVADTHRGFLSIGESIMEGYQGADQKESYIWGLDIEESSTNASSLLAPNRWPNQIPEQRGILNAYFKEIHQCAFKILRGIAVSLGNDQDFFVEHFNAPTSRGSLIYYPPMNNTTGHYGVSPHTDFGCISVLAQRSRGLRVESTDGEWLEVLPVEGTLVVNVGDLLSRWSNGRFRSVPHCVVNEARNARYSVVVFVDPDSQTMIDPILDSGELPRYKAVNCETYITGRFNRSFAYRH